jgi:hypothetical protein
MRQAVLLEKMRQIVEVVDLVLYLDVHAQSAVVSGATMYCMRWLASGYDMKQ